MKKNPLKLKFKGKEGTVENAPSGYLVHSISKDSDTGNYYLVLEAGEEKIPEINKSEFQLLYVGKPTNMKKVELAEVVSDAEKSYFTFLTETGEKTLTVFSALFHRSPPTINDRKFRRLETVVNQYDTQRSRIDYIHHVWRNEYKEMNHRLSHYGGYDPAKVRSLVESLSAQPDLSDVKLAEKSSSLDTLIEGKYVGPIDFLDNTKKDVEEKVKAYYSDLGKRLNAHFENVRIPWRMGDPVSKDNYLFVNFSAYVECGYSHKRRQIEVSLTQRKQ